MTKTLKRITVEEVQQAYKATNLKPIRGDFLRVSNKRKFNSPKCACALTALAIHAGVDPVAIALRLRVDMSDDAFRAMTKKLGLGPAYAEGFMQGFDGSDPCGLTGNALKGFQDGLAAAKVIKPKDI